MKRRIFHPAPRSGEGGPPEGRWKGPRLRGYLFAVRPLHHASHGPPPPLRIRFAGAEADHAIRRTLVISLPAAPMRSMASAIGSMATAI